MKELQLSINSTIQIQGIPGGYPGTQAFLAKLRSLELIEDGNVGTGYVWVRPVAGKRGEIEEIIADFGGDDFEGLSTSEAAIQYRHHLM